MQVQASTVVSRFLEALRYTFPREFYIPKEVRETKPMVPEGTDLAIWTWEGEGRDGKPKYYGIAFAGKQNKPLWHYTFTSESNRQRQIDETIKSRKMSLDYKKEQLEKRKNFQHTYKVGDIFSTSWGYDQTNVDFYQVTDVRGKMLIVRPIAGKIVREDRGADYVSADPDKFTGSPIKVIPGPHGVKIDGHYGSLWDGKPEYQTPSGMGH